ncbi:MAG: caspase family protein [Gammaproteobacteria bacterium]|nr:caspase family protein [Gammaproteobacteria bacterium]
MKTLSTTVLLSAFMLGCASTGDTDADKIAINADANLTRDNVDNVFVVDCLLPGQVRSLGRQANYLTARRPIKTSALDCEIRGGEYVAFDRADYATALKIWLPQAQAGSAEAQTQVGEIYEKGMGVEPDYDIAAVWYKKAANQGYSRAQINLGYMYEKGLGVDQNITKAMNWYRKASGLPDDVEYVSSIELSAKNEELESLKVEVKALEKKADQYKKQLQRAQQKLNRAQKEEKNTKSDIEKMQQRIANLKRSLDQSVSGDTSAQIVVIEKEVSDTTGGTKQAAGKTESVKMPPKEVQHLIQTLFAKIKEKETNLQQQGLIIANLSKETSSFRQQLQKVELQKLAMAAPSIEILDPPLAITRGKPGVLLRSPVKSQTIYGRVSAPAGVKTFHFNNKQVFLKPDNSFKVPVAITKNNTLVNLKAVDKQDKSTVLDFIISSPEMTSTIVAPALQTSLIGDMNGIHIGRYFALIIGNNKYKHLQNLKTAVTDAEETAKILSEKYNFETTLLLNADRYEILSALHKLRQQLQKGDNLLVYYAGHGDLDKINDRGYWLPTDAEADNTANWISNIAVTDMLNTLPANHIMVIADSCYSGTMTRTAVPRIDSAIPHEIQKKWLKLMSKSQSRTVLSSGGVQPVLDEGGGKHSIFAKAFLDALSNNNDVLQGYALYRQVTNVVSQSSANIQTPQYAPIKHAGHETGQFFFIPKG